MQNASGQAKGIVMTGIGFIGLGVMGTRMLNAVLDHPVLEPVIAWDPSDSALRKAQASAGDLATATCAEEVAAHPGIACVYIASPPSSHLGYISIAHGHGKAVFCEKPLALDRAAAMTTVEAIARDGHRAAMNFPHASAPASVTLARQMAEGGLGTIESVEVAIVFPQWPEAWQVEAAWLARRAEGGFVREVVTHMLFLARRTLGSLELLGADITWQGDPAAAETAADIRLRAGGVPVHVRGRVTPGAQESVYWTVTGSEGALRLVDWYGLEERQDDGSWAPHPLHRPYDPAGARRAAARAQLDGLCALLEGRPHTMATLREGLDVQEMIETILLDTDR
jgi:predicted dehydrogenase